MFEGAHGPDAYPAGFRRHSDGHLCGLSTTPLCSCFRWCCVALLMQRDHSTPPMSCVSLGHEFRSWIPSYRRPLPLQRRRSLGTTRRCARRSIPADAEPLPLVPTLERPDPPATGVLPHRLLQPVVFGSALYISVGRADAQHPRVAGADDRRVMIAGSPPRLLMAAAGTTACHSARGRADRWA
jgi:hypothetical protein